MKARNALETGRLDGGSPGGLAAPPPLPPPPATLPLPLPLPSPKPPLQPPPLPSPLFACVAPDAAAAPVSPAAPAQARGQAIPLPGGIEGGGDSRRAMGLGEGAPGGPEAERRCQDGRLWCRGRPRQGMAARRRRPGTDSGGACRHLKEPIMAGEHRAGRRLPWPRGPGGRMELDASRATMMDGKSQDKRGVAARYYGQNTSLSQRNCAVA